MKEPTDEQVKEFWEWCGIEINHIKGEGICHKIGNDWFYGMPPIDLNNLFKYAVPVLSYASIRFTKEIQIKDTPFYCVLKLDEHPWEVGGWGETNALALFWAIWGVIHAI